MRELPSVKATYDKLHGKGFEIVGISFDQKKEALARIVKREKMAWPQYFETRSEEHRIGEKLGIESIPTMWLIDKEGNLRDLDARHNLAGRVEKLLAEK
jgi:peroxiredoxin